jgi:hypothetical protein
MIFQYEPKNVAAISVLISKYSVWRIFFGLFRQQNSRFKQVDVKPISVQMQAGLQ